ncbi:MAG: class I SAM-dependent methyltransferase [Pseudotabrizicola sp.]|uniref:class I SAM-dependent methyltransferase n=1 Tax=Pseudotabrizicola sp. TaxID=2939647 RepID=UPI0027308231|nr:class I SAM-dependent methyltransferase [Pseudotabrizicola sp.]MDP2080068.1 class I SAM-dependent methyltransferase [Pseudotabrizicola sp.]MDZ7575514.1 class I SAM-dependent methyltransferase [Pseudotabrizicola sp.]
MAHPISPYMVPGFYDTALAKGRHRDIVGGRWDETGRIQMQILRDAGMQPHHRLLDIGAGSLRLGCKAVPYLNPGHYWATDASRALMLRGRGVELGDPARLPEDHLIEDSGFSLPGIPPDIDFAIAFGVFTHLPLDVLDAALARMRPRLPNLRRLLFTVFMSPDAKTGPLRQADGVVTHPDRPPYHFDRMQVEQICARTGWDAKPDGIMLPRGQVLIAATSRM